MWVEAGGALLRRLGSFVNSPAIDALPQYGLVLPENLSRFHVFNEPVIPLFMPDLDFGDLPEKGRDLGESFLLSYIREARIDGGMLGVFSGRSGGLPVSRSWLRLSMM